jgi:hypothetical protein
VVKEVKQAKSNAVVFTKQLAGTAVAISLLGLGAYAVYQGEHKTKMAIAVTGLLFSAAVNILVGSIVFYKVLMNKA